MSWALTPLTYIVFTMTESGRLRKRCSLVVMAKSPVPGQVKTRLIPFIGSQCATQVYQDLLSRILQELVQVEASSVLSCTPDTHHAMLRSFSSQYGWRRRYQGQGDLGNRMARIFSRCQRESDYTIIVGSDLANINKQIIYQCIDRLTAGNDLVLGATEDGGYGLIAMSRLHSGVFRKIPWSTDRVLQVTMSRARQMKLKTAIINGLWDVDTYKDYRRWRQLCQQD